MPREKQRMGICAVASGPLSITVRAPAQQSQGTGQNDLGICSTASGLLLSSVRTPTQHRRDALAADSAHAHSSVMTRLLLRRGPSAEASGLLGSSVRAHARQRLGS
jgi:hypothetical protein